MSQSNLDTYAVSIFDTLEMKPYFVTVETSSVDLDEVLLAAYNEILAEDLTEPLTLNYIRELPEQFSDFVVISILKTKEKNLYVRPELDDADD
jgi:hypothetical protein